MDILYEMRYGFEMFATIFVSLTAVLTPIVLALKHPAFLAGFVLTLPLGMVILKGVHLLLEVIF